MKKRFANTVALGLGVLASLLGSTASGDEPAATREFEIRQDRPWLGGHPVELWGLRVDETTFQRIAADKEDDGIIQNDVVGEKRRGALAPEYRIATTGGAITDW